MEMTQDVMANSLVYWVQDLRRAGMLDRGSKIWALTSEGTSKHLPSYGVVSSAKAALESHVRQLAMEFARLDEGVAVNCIRAGVTDTPAMRRIPEADRMVEVTLARNPHGRLTTPQDVAQAVVHLSGSEGDWISGNIIGVDGAEAITG
jgi:enoyl-[acyl-carrier-protein] reductase (NADH)